MSAITTHVLDTALGRPAQGVPLNLSIKLDGHGDGDWKQLGSGVTNADGRVNDLLPKDQKLSPGIYRITFGTSVYFAAIGVESFYPSVAVLFEIKNIEQHYHIPLLLSPFGYSTYRGS